MPDNAYVITETQYYPEHDITPYLMYIHGPFNSRDKALERLRTESEALCTKHNTDHSTSAYNLRRTCEAAISLYRGSTFKIRQWEVRLCSPK